MKKPIKFISIGCGLLLLLFVILAVLIPSKDRDEKTKGGDTTEQQVTTPESEEKEQGQEQNLEEQVMPEYRVVSQDDVSFGKARRYSYKVVAEFPITEEGIREISKKIIEEKKSAEAFNALDIFFYDYEDLTSNAFTLARVVYAPYGDWSKAIDVSAGDYSKHEVVYKLRDKVKNPDEFKDKRPTAEEAKLCEEFDRVGVEYPDLIEDEEMAEKVVKKEGGTIDEVLNAVEKCSTWIFL